MYWFAFRDDNPFWRLRKVVLMASTERNGQVVYRTRYFTSFFPRLKRRLAERRVQRLQIMGANK